MVEHGCERKHEVHLGDEVRTDLEINKTYLVITWKDVTEVIGVGVGNDLENVILGHVKLECFQGIVHNQLVIVHELLPVLPPVKVVLHAVCHLILYGPHSPDPEDRDQVVDGLG